MRKQTSKQLTWLLIVLITVSLLPVQSIGAEKPGDSVWIFKDSSNRLLTAANLQTLDSKLLSLARNEVFARHGYIFKDVALQKYFSNKTWYKRNASYKGNFTGVESKNVELIKKYEVLRKKYEANPYAASNITPISASFDLNGDGKSDTVKMTLLDSENSKYELNVNGIRVKGFGSEIEHTFSIVDINLGDGKKEIAVQEFGPSDDYLTEFYCYDGNRLFSMGKVEGLCAGKDDGSGTVLASTRFNILQTWFYKDEYKLDSRHKLVHMDKKLYPVSWPQDQTLTMLKPLSLYKDIGSKVVSVKLKAGDKVKLIGADDKAWVLVETKNGTRGWFQIINFSQVKENSLDASEVFSGLCFAD